MTEETRKFWNTVAPDWQVQIGINGDQNRQLNSDPVLWRMAGDVSGLRVLDAGCGTGYLTGKLVEKGADCSGVDFSEEMISIAGRNHPEIDFKVDSCRHLATVDSNSMDLLVSNYVLMDLPDLTGAVRSFFRVLKPGGKAVVVFSHPCFPQADAEKSEDMKRISYHWPHSYFTETKRVDPPWGHFTAEFIRFHRPLSTYWKEFTEAGFTVTDFDEPHIIPDRFHLAEDKRKLSNSMTRPYSVAFSLEKPHEDEGTTWKK